MVNWIRIWLTTLGIRSCRMICQWDAPWATEDSMNSWLETLSAAARRVLAKPGVAPKARARMVWGIPTPSPAMMASVTSSEGIAIQMSRIRMMMSSTFPGK